MKDQLLHEMTTNGMLFDVRASSKKRSLKKQNKAKNIFTNRVFTKFIFRS